MKRSSALILIVIVSILTLVGCSTNKNNNDVISKSANVKEVNEIVKETDKISVVVSIFPQYDFTRAIVGDKADLTMLIKPGAESHSFDPSPADIIKIQNADAFIYIGGENEKWVETILESMDTSSKKVIRLMDYVNIVEEEIVEGMEDFHDHDHDHDKHEEYDEHIWTSPKNAILMINAIAKELADIDPKNAMEYKQNADEYISQIKEVDTEIRTIVNSSEDKLIVVGDRFPFRYFVDEYGLDYRAAFSACSTESEASAGTIAYLIDTINEHNLTHVYYIELSNQNIARIISEQTGAEMLLLHSAHNVTRDDFEAGINYLSIIKQNAENLRKGL